MMGEVKEFFNTNTILEQFEFDLKGWRREKGVIVKDGKEILPEFMIQRWIGVVRPYISDVAGKSNLQENQIREICRQLHDELSEYVYLNWVYFSGRISFEEKPEREPLVTDPELTQKQRVNQINSLIIQTLHFVYISLSAAKDGGLRSTVFGGGLREVAQKAAGSVFQ